MLANQEFDLLAPGKRDTQLKPYREKVLWQHGLLAEGLGQLLGLSEGHMKEDFKSEKNKMRESTSLNTPASVGLLQVWKVSMFGKKECANWREV